MLFKPTAALRSVLEITPEMLEKMGVKALILDLDNTLTTHNNPKPADGVPEWLSLMKNSGMNLLVVSNNHAPRVAPFAEMLGLEFVPEGAKPLPKGYNIAVKRFGLPKNCVCAIGDQIFTDILGANLAGIKSIFVYPIEFESGFFFKIKRFFEKPFRPKSFDTETK
ncbi:MAG: YqeG family HAD IIIA-type phosphatase [Oscillospiraceae bacterium]|nr:YqeG family HAD IIIA-type phosphatase [Oscillospiraceae bacterium]